MAKLHEILFQTKLHQPPLASDLVPRLHLFEQFQHGLNRQITLVVAPAGFGKTTLVSAWLESLSRASEEGISTPPAAWLSLDEFDSELNTFLAYFIGALRRIHQHACPETQALLHTPLQPPLKLVAATLSNELELIPERFILVLDDYHMIRGQAVPNLLNELIAHWPAPLHLVLISRTNPPLPLYRLRTNNKLTEIRSHDLRFGSEEISAFLGTDLSVSLDPSAIDLLEQHTEGWVAGLRLAKLYLQKRDNLEVLQTSIFRSNTDFIDYFVNEILEQQVPALQKFLLKTSILDKFCAPLCGAIGAEHDPAWRSQECIEWLVRAGFFIVPLDDNQTWYRYHFLFRDLLQQHAQIELGSERIAALHHQAAVWFAQEGMVRQAISHALQAGDLELVASLMVRELPEVLNQEDRPTLEHWLQLLPETFIQNRPELLMIKAWVYQFAWQLGPQAKVLEQVEVLLADNPASPLLIGDRQLLEGQISALKAEHAFLSNLPDRAQIYCQEALENLPESWTYLRGGVMLYLGLSLRASGDSLAAERFLRDQYEALNDKANAYSLRLLQALCLIYLHNGDLDQVYQTARVLFSQATQHSLPIMQGWARYFLGVVLYQWNDLRASARYFAELADHRFKYQFLTARGGLTGLALIYQIRGEHTKAWQMAFLLGQIDLEHTGGEEDQTRSLRARLSLWDGDLETALRWADQFSALPSDEPLTWLEVPHLTQAQIFLNHKKPADVRRAHHILDMLEGIVERTYNLRLKIDILALRALAWNAQGKTDTGLAILQQAVEAARPGGHVRVFVDLGAPMQEMLSKLAGQGIAVESINRILGAFEDSPPGFDGFQPKTAFNHLANPSAQALLEPLTPRELEIMRLLREPLSPKEIASQLGIQYSTTKRHMINIYGKLGVNSRWEAIAKAIELGILPEH